MGIGMGPQILVGPSKYWGTQVWPVPTNRDLPKKSTQEIEANNGTPDFISTQRPIVQHAVHLPLRMPVGANAQCVVFVRSEAQRNWQSPLNLTHVLLHPSRNVGLVLKLHVRLFDIIYWFRSSLWKAAWDSMCLIRRIYLNQCHCGHGVLCGHPPVLFGPTFEPLG